jgi:hypothetical protein
VAGSETGAVIQQEVLEQKIKHQSIGVLPAQPAAAKSFQSSNLSNPILLGGCNVKHEWWS